MFKKRLIYKFRVLQKARELSAKLLDMEQISLQTPKKEPVPKPAEKEMPSKTKIPPKPVISAEAAAYLKLIRFIINPTVLIQLIRNKRLNGRKFMERTAKSRIRKAYLNG